MTFDATAGSATANSYATVAEADAYLAVRGDTSTWTALTTAQKEYKLQWAAIVLDTLRYRGARSSETQPLKWPRCEDSAAPRFAGLTVSSTGYLKDEDGYDVPSTTVPICVKNAQAEMAFRLIADDWTAGLGPITQESLKVGPIEFGPKSHRAIPAAVVALLRPFLAVIPGSGGRLVRG